MPTEVECQPWDNRRSKNCPNVRTRVKEAGGQGTLFFWKPDGSGLDGCGKVPSFPKTEGHPSPKKTSDTSHQGVPHGG